MFRIMEDSKKLHWIFAKRWQQFRLIELINDELIKNSQEMLDLLFKKMICFSVDDVCLKVTQDTVLEKT